MLLYLSRLFTHAWPGLDRGGLSQVALRASLAALTSFVLAVLLGPRLIRWLDRRFREPVKIDSPAVARLHAAKQSTPTMGGVFIVAGLLIASAVLGDWTNPHLGIALGLMVALACIGAADDLIKLTTPANGMRARMKLLLQTAVALAAVLATYYAGEPNNHSTEVHVPLLASAVDLGWLYFPLATLVIVGTSNAVNLTDGLDGLAGGCVVCASGAMCLVVYAAGHVEWARYLGVPHVSGASELAVVAGGMIGGVLGFLWFNCHPASVFMGDTGSLPLGGLLGFLAVAARQEVLLAMIGGVFFVEALSVIAQVASFRATGKRVLRCAPLHHHFQLLGWGENKIVARFWIAAALCAIVGLAALKPGPAGSSNELQLSSHERLTR